MGLVSVNKVIEAIAEDIKEKLREAMVGVREEMKPVLYSAEADRDGGEIDDDQGDEGLDQSASAVTTALLSSASVLKKGWLVKKGEVRRNWKVRYFVLFEDGRMPYYRAPKRAQRDQPQGCIYLTGKVRAMSCHVVCRRVRRVVDPRARVCRTGAAGATSEGQVGAAKPVGRGGRDGHAHLRPVLPKSGRPRPLVLPPPILLLLLTPPM
jgi:hypothetical protein